MIEIWKYIPEYEGLYKVSNLGRVLITKRLRTDGRTFPEKIMSKKPLTKGYINVGLHKQGVKENVFVHRLVAAVFVDNPDSLPMINHKDGNRSNNVSTNLEWCTASHNVEHGFRVLGRKQWNKGNKSRAFIYCICGIKFYPPKRTSKYHTKSCAMKARNLYLKKKGLI